MTWYRSIGLGHCHCLLLCSQPCPATVLCARPPVLGPLCAVSRVRAEPRVCMCVRCAVPCAPHLWLGQHELAAHPAHVHLAQHVAARAQHSTQHTQRSARSKTGDASCNRQGANHHYGSCWTGGRKRVERLVAVPSAVPQAQRLTVKMAHSAPTHSRPRTSANIRCASALGGAAQGVQLSLSSKGPAQDRSLSRSPRLSFV